MTGVLRSLPLLLAASAVSLAAAALQTETVAIGRVPIHAAVDATTGRAFVANAGNGRTLEGMSIGVVELNGRTVNLPVAASPSQVTVSAVHRRAIVVHPSGSHATLIDVDTLQMRTVMTGLDPVRAVIAEKTGFAYVVGRGATTLLGAGSGTITEVELRSGIARTYPVEGFTPESAATHPDGSRVYVVGTMPQRASEWMPGYVQAFDTAAKTMGEPVPLGRMPRHVLVSATGDEIYVVGHVDHLRQELPAADRRRNSIRPMLFVLDPGTLATRQSLALPDTRDFEQRGVLFAGRAELHPSANMLYLVDTPNERLSIVVPGLRQVRSIELEAPGYGLAVNAATKTLLVSFNTVGHVGIFSLEGERLDTLPLARAPSGNEFAPGYGIAVDPATATAYATNGHAGTITVLRPGTREPVPGVVNFTDLWFDPTRQGNGVFLDHQGATLFATLFTHDPLGNPAWLFMSNGVRQADGSFAGDLYRTRGPLVEATRNASAVGSLRFHPGRGESATLVYYADGSLHTRVVQRLRINDAPRECRWKVGRSRALTERSNFTGLWSNPADPGWGIAVSHQGDTAFAVLFTYDEQNRPSWLVMSNGKRNANGQFAGDVYRAAGGKIEVMGTLALAFTSADNGTLRYRLSGLDFQGPILRQTFSRLTTECSS